MKIVTVIGARPQFIKAAVISRAIETWNKSQSEIKLKEVIIHTGQHYDVNMSDVFFEEMEIPKPQYNLHIGGGTHGAMTGQMIEKIEEVLFVEKPDLMLVYGDTDSTLAGALAAAKLHIPVAHVEAGLRSYNMKMPEEINRILTDRISRWLYCPTATAMKNLEQEGYKHFSASLEFVGDVMYDAALFYQEKDRATSFIKKIVAQQTEFYLATVHRAENTNSKERLNSIFTALDRIAEEKTVILPLHPRTRKILVEQSMDLKNVTTVNPVGYFDMIHLLSQCQAVITDSGGVQKEAYYFKKPCITLRDETEWIELVERGVNQLVGASLEKIVASEKNISSKICDFSESLYGDGHAGEKIIHNLIGSFQEMLIKNDKD